MSICPLYTWQRNWKGAAVISPDRLSVFLWKDEIVLCHVHISLTYLRHLYCEKSSSTATIVCVVYSSCTILEGYIWLVMLCRELLWFHLERLLVCL